MKQCQENGIGKCKSERGTHDNCRQMGKQNASWKEPKLQMEEKYKEQMQLGKGHI